MSDDPERLLDIEKVTRAPVPTEEVEREPLMPQSLRNWADGLEAMDWKPEILIADLRRAADHIAALDARNKRLEGALREAIYEVVHLSPNMEDGKYRSIIRREIVDGWRAALDASKEGKSQ